MGERNFSFTVAFAALREFEKRGYSHYTLEECQRHLRECTLQKLSVWENITGTRYEPPCSEAEHVCATNIPVACMPALDLPEVKHSCVTFAKDSSSKQLEHKRQLLNLLSGEPVLRYGIDTLAIPEDLTSGAEVIWFQCPWISPRSIIYATDDYTHTLVSGFLLNLADQIEQGVYVCIGIAKSISHIKHYHLEGLLGKGLAAIINSTPVLQKYKFIGADDELVKEVLSFGYHHQSVYEDGDLHKKIINDHVTLIFQRKKKEKVKPMRGRSKKPSRED